MTIDWFWANAARIVDLTGWHLMLTLVPTVLGLLIAVPLGWWADSSRRVYPVLVGAAGLLYTIPSLALFVLLPPIIGTKILDPINVIIALTLYTVALLVRIVADGLASVPFEALEAATAMGYRRWQQLLLVELPVAVPVLIAGLRVAVMTNISLVTVAALVGIPQLGSLFTQGFSLNLFVPLLVGIMLCLVLAVLLDVLTVRLGKALTPWRRGVVTE